MPDEEHEFLNWQGPPNCGSELQCTVVTGQTNNVTATFVKVTKYKLTVQLAGNSSVTSSPSGITCGTDCTQSYAQGRNVTLTATLAMATSSPVGVVATLIAPAQEIAASQ